MINSEEREFYDKVGSDKRSSRAVVEGGGERDISAEVPSTAAPSPADNPNRLTASMTGEKRWAANHDVFWGATQTYDALPAGLYRCAWSEQIGATLVKQVIDTDELLELPDDASASIIAEFETFWQIGDAFRSRGFLWKRGFLLWGPPGSGKTSCICLLINRLIADHDGIVLFLDNPRTGAQCLQMVRTIEPKRPMIVVMEDLDSLVEHHGENEYLSLLDGEAQVDNIVFLSTTNYPERLDKRFIDRPSRFDTVRYLAMPSAAARKTYLKAKEPSLTKDELKRWVDLSEGFSVAHLKEMIIAVRCFNQPLSQVAERLELMHERKPTSEDTPDKIPVGFASNGGAGIRDF